MADGNLNGDKRMERDIIIEGGEYQSITRRREEGGGGGEKERRRRKERRTKAEESGKESEEGPETDSLVRYGIYNTVIYCNLRGSG